jgi:hypothetical protein
MKDLDFIQSNKNDLDFIIYNDEEYKFAFKWHNLKIYKNDYDEYILTVSDEEYYHLDETIQNEINALEELDSFGDVTLYRFE